MSTQDCPGANPANHDKLAMGSWSEHNDGSIIFVESTEGGRVVYSMFDMSKKPVVEYRDSMSKKGFEDAFTKNGWTWHDRTPMNWDKVMAAGVTDGHKHPNAEAQISEAERVAKSRESHARRFDKRKWSHMADSVGRKGKVIVDKVQRAIMELRT